MSNLTIIGTETANIYQAKTETAKPLQENYKLFGGKIDKNEEDLARTSRKNDYTKKYETDTGAVVTERYEQGKLSFIKVNVHNQEIEIEWENGKLKTLAYHEPNEEFDFNANSYKIEFLDDGTYNITHRDDKKRDCMKSQGKVNDENFKDLTDYIKFHLKEHDVSLPYKLKP